jgi:putative ABC transport system permease protein
VVVIVAKHKSKKTAIAILEVPFDEILSMAAESLWSNRLRSGLTMLGVIIGIAAVIAITSVGQGVQASTEAQLQALGTNLINVIAGAPTVGGVNLGGGLASTLSLDDAEAVANAPAISLVAPYLQRMRQVSYTNQNTSTTILGTESKFPQARNIFPKEGRYFDPKEIATAQPLVVLGDKVCGDLFGTIADPKNSLTETCNSVKAIGKKVRIQGYQYDVIGVMEPKGSTGGVDQDDRVYIPLQNMASRIVGSNSIRGISISGMWVKAQNESELDAAQFQLTNLLRIRHKIFPPQLDDFRIINQTDILNTFTSIVGLLTLMVGAIAAISLVVGGIGIANIMLVSVVERTREIGVRKALGATRSAILSQFLAEAILVSVVGGTIGIGLGIAIAFGAASIFGFPFVISWLSVFGGFGLSMTVGLIAGVIPAQSAARLDPIQALRSD